MAQTCVKGVRLAGIAAAVPEERASSTELEERFGVDVLRQISESTGVYNRRTAGAGLCSSDLCYCAANQLLGKLQWDPGSIDALVFVSQTPDYILPATSCCLQGRLGLSKSCAALDVSLGCSGYVYGLWLVHQLMATGGIRRALLLAGDTINRLVSPCDRSVAALFGDAGTATALEQSASFDGQAFFCLGSDGAMANHLIVPVGGFRERPHARSSVRELRPDGNTRSDEDLYMNGAEVFGFTLREVPLLIRATMLAANWCDSQVDAYVLHQANRFMLQHLAKKTKIPPSKLPLSLSSFGNTSVASIPLTIATCLEADITNQPMNLLLAGFGVGFSWAGAAITAGPIVVPPCVQVRRTEGGELHVESI
jgi:3-oxoacyl-[acyl-carrier-protein] synthase-3